MVTKWLLHLIWCQSSWRAKVVMYELEVLLHGACKCDLMANFLLFVMKNYVQSWRTMVLIAWLLYPTYSSFNSSIYCLSTAAMMASTATAPMTI